MSRTLILKLQEMAGFSRSKYKPTVPPAPSVAYDADDEHHYMFSTQFQPCDARRAFPCFDEPALKASFELSIEIPDDQIALCNTPHKETTVSSRPGGLKDWKWKVVKFERSPVMSTYLYTWAFGDFAYVEAETEKKYNGKRLPVRVYTTKGLEEQGRYALEHAWKIIDLLSEVSTLGSFCKTMRLTIYEMFQIVCSTLPRAHEACLTGSSGLPSIQDGSAGCS